MEIIDLRSSCYSSRGSSRIKEMYDIEMREATKLIDDTKRDAAAALMKTQKAEQDVNRQKDRYNQLSGGRDAFRKEIDALERQIAENEAVRIVLRLKSRIFESLAHVREDIQSIDE